jgi:hypothetical protein
MNYSLIQNNSVNIYTYIHTYINIYTYTHKYTHIYIYTYIYTHTYIYNKNKYNKTHTKATLLKTYSKAKVTLSSKVLTKPPL